MPAFPCQTCQQINVVPLSDYAANEQTIPPAPLPFVETGTFVNEAVYFKLNCQGAEVPVYTGVLPTWITIDAANCQLVGAPGTFTGGGGVGGFGGVSPVNDIAQNALDDFVLNAIIEGELTPPPLAVAPNTEYNDPVSIPNGAPEGEEVVFTGVLPPWIIIDNENGVITAEPGTFIGNSPENVNLTALEILTDWFEDAIESGELTYQPIPPPPPVGPNWSTLAWGVPVEGYFNGSGSFVPSSAAGASFNDSVACGEDGGANVENTATIVCTSVANCRISGLYVFSADTGGTTVTVAVYRDAPLIPGNQLGLFTYTLNLGSESNSFTFDFVAPVATLFVYVSIGITANGAGSSSASNITGTVSNVP